MVYKKSLKLVDECRKYSKLKQCRYRNTVYSMTEKIQFLRFMFPQVVQTH